MTLGLHQVNELILISWIQLNIIRKLNLQICYNFSSFVNCWPNLTWFHNSPHLYTGTTSSVMERPKTSVNVHKSSSEKSSQKAQNQKRKPPRRNKKRMTIWFKPEVYDWLKKNVSNVSEFLNQLVESVKSQVQPAVILISKIDTGREGFEPPTAGLRVPRSAWLSYRPFLVWFC